ncbi:MAG: T9SS type A sorting domain-containing protein, partial [Eudoraea sp.]|nr:T9SS type A sorting domain-containing protein [Eudoraea sp.]
FNNIAAPSAKITELVVEDGVTPSTVPFTVKIIGEFLPESTDDFEIRFDDQPLEDVQIITEADGSKVITATVPTFSGNPELFVITNSTTPGGTDGGPSNPLTFFEDGKLALNIVANNAQFEYGQDIGPTYYNVDPNSPDYVAPYTVEGLPLDDDGVPVPFEALGLPPVILGNSAIDDVLVDGGFPIVFDYVITPSFGDQEYDQELFQINFIPGFIDPDEGKKGYLTITKKDLTITPYPIEGEPGNTIPEEIPPFIYTYGDPIDLTLNYAYDDTGILNNTFYSVLDASHQSDFKDGLPNKFKAIVSKFKAIVSTENFLNYNLPEDLLNGGSWSASNRTIENKFKAIVSGQNVIDLDNDDFTNFIESRFDFEEGDTSKFKAIVSKFKAIVSSEDLFSGSVDLSIDNKFKAIVSKFKAIVSTDDPDRPYSSYESVFTIIDAEDAPTEDDEERAISEIFSLNLITGLEVTPEGENHYVYSGAYLNDMSANFNITYLPGSLIVLPRDLNVTIENKVIPYGTVLTKDDITTTFDGWAFEGEFQESAAIVFPEEEGGIPYYFIRLKEDGTPLDDTELEIDELQELGEYLIKIRDPKNYLIKPVNNTFGTLTIEPVALQFDPAALSVTYGETPVIEPGFGPFAYDDDASTVFPEAEGGIPYYFKKVGGDDTEYTIDGPEKMEVGEYEIFMYDDLEDNYLIVPNPERGTLTVEPATLLVKTNPLDIKYGISVSDVIETTITGFAYDEDLSTVFPDGNGGTLIPYLFVKGTDAPLGIDAVRELGTYEIAVEEPSSGNYSIVYDTEHSSLTIGEAPISFTSLALNISYGETPVIEPNFVGFAPWEDETILYVDGQLPYYFQKDGTIFTLADIATMNVGVYDIFITDDPNDNYDFTPDENLGTLTISTATLTFSPADITVTYGETPLIAPASITGFSFDESVLTVFPNGLPYYFEASGNQFGPDDILNAGSYSILITDDPSDNYQIIYGSTGILTVNKAILTVSVEDLLVDEGTTIVSSMINTAITGYAYNEGEQDVFPGGLQYSIVDVEGNMYTGAVGVYFIKIVEPPIFNYVIEYNPIGTVYVNSLDVNRKIRTYTDCVELNPGDPDGLNYIAHFRYVNPNDEVVYILAGPENQLTGPAALTAIGELPNKFLPGEHTFEFRFDGNTLKWELTSLDSNHKTSTTTNVNANTNKCDPDDSTRIGEIPTYVLHPNPVNGILYIEQDVSAIVTLEVFDFFGISYLTTQLDGSNAPTTHQIDMSGSNYPDGMYFIRLTTASDVQVFSVIKDE